MSNKLVELINQLVSLDNKQLSLEEVSVFNKQLAKAIFHDGSKTKGNTNCVKYIEYGNASVEGKLIKASVQGLKIKNKALFLSEILCVLENVDIPPTVSSRLPELTVNEWKACLRMATLLLNSLEKTKKAKRR